MPTYGPDYVLRWPVDIFVREARAIARIHNAGKLKDAARRLLDEVMSGPQPLRDLDELVPAGAWASSNYDAIKTFLNRLADDADDLPKQRRQYWAQRHRRESPANLELTMPDLRREWLQVVTEMDQNGYLDQLEPSVCADDLGEQERADRITASLTERAGIRLEWRPPVLGDAVPDDVFFTYIEVIHDCIARPRTRTFHDYGGDWHYDDFAMEPGQELYRWRVNRLLAHTTLDLRLADEGDDTGFLVHTTDPSRADLVTRVLADVTEPVEDPVARAIRAFRSRGANRLDKKDACRALAHELEPIRAKIKDELLSADEGLLFRIANEFAIRHNKADQRDDYTDDYLDWIFWNYLSTIELMRRLARRTTPASENGAS